MTERIYRGRVAELREEGQILKAAGERRIRCATETALREAAAIGLTATEAAEYTGLTPPGVYNAVARLGISLAKAHPERTYKYPDVTVEIHQTVRGTAIANRGKASAAQIAAAVGVSRNSIIGHWNRARAAGVIA